MCLEIDSFLTKNRRQADVVDIFEVERGADCLRSKSLWPGSESLISRPRQKCLKDLISSAGLALCVALRCVARVAPQSPVRQIRDRTETDHRSTLAIAMRFSRYVHSTVPCIYFKL